MQRALCIKIHRAVFSIIVKKKKKKLERKLSVGGRFRREETYVYLQLTHADVWQKPTKHCKAIILQLRKGKEKKKERLLRKFSHKLLHISPMRLLERMQ